VGKQKQLSMAYSFCNKCAKNLCKRTVLVQLIVKNVVTFFFGTQCCRVETKVTVSPAVQHNIILHWMHFLPQPSLFPGLGPAQNVLACTSWGCAIQLTKELLDTNMKTADQ